MKDSEKAYEKIRRMIITTEFKPGQEINVTALVEELKLGKTPIREALNRLSYEGFVRILSRKGMLVTNLDVDDMDKLRTLRLYFVRFISEQVILYSGEVDIKRIRDIQEKLFDTEDTFMNCLSADIKFHELTYELCNNKYAEDMLKRNLYLSIRLMVMKKNLGVTIQSIIDDYSSLIECIRNKDRFRLESLLLSHIIE